MPKAPSTPHLPLNGLFPIAKPSGPSSMRVIDSITPLLLASPLFEDLEKLRNPPAKNKRKKNVTHLGLKIGQGGTLDPLADGVLVIGVNRGTKHLNRFLECTKEYESIGLLGASTTTYDSEGEIMTTGPSQHVTRADVEKVLDRFRGDIVQIPPIFSALKMEGKPLYEYARESKPLPRAIPSRKCTVSIDLVDFTPASDTPKDGGHEYRWPEKRLSSEEKSMFRRLTEMVHQAQEKDEMDKEAKRTAAAEEEAVNVSAPSASDPAPKSDLDLNLDLDLEHEAPEVSPSGVRPATFTVRMTVTSGTYVRSIVHDIGLALGCGAHVVKLTRTRQGEFTLHGDEEALSALEAGKETTSDIKSDSTPALNSLDTSASHTLGPTNSSIPWSVWSRAITEQFDLEKADADEKEEALQSGATPEEMSMQFGREAMSQKRKMAPLREWENELLRRFVSVPVPISGSNDRGAVFRDA